MLHPGRSLAAAGGTGLKLQSAEVNNEILDMSKSDSHEPSAVGYLEIPGAFSSRMSQIAKLLKQLVAIDSVNPSLIPGGAGEARIARFVATWLDGAGLEVVIDEPTPGRPNVIGIARGSGGGRSLMLNAHMDTVGVAGMERPHASSILDGRLYGRGACDAKGSLAAIMFVAAAAKQRSLRGDVLVTAVVDEEYASIGTRSVVKRWRADAAIVAEATALNVCTAHNGSIWLEVETVRTAENGLLVEFQVSTLSST